jgi:hypothetical protein|tara:strand:- start:126 stop:917 length:792 start_codon:yes stop_codon:yes gene_type:complete
MAIKPTITAYGGGQQQFPIFLNRFVTDYQYDKTERDFAKVINENVKRSPNGFFDLIGTNGEIIPQIVSARKHQNKNAIGQDNHTDISVVQRNGRMFKINTKGSFAPIYSNGNLDAVFASAPAMTKRFLQICITKYKALGFKDNQLITSGIPPIYAELRGETNRKMVMGTPQIGGPIDFYFEGQPTGVYNEEQNSFNLDSSILNAYNLSKTKFFYLVAQPPPVGDRFNYKALDRKGMPIIHNQGRSVNLVDRSFVPAGSTVIRI